jgi:hypothetical protein
MPSIVLVNDVDTYPSCGMMMPVPQMNGLARLHDGHQ